MIRWFVILFLSVVLPVFLIGFLSSVLSLLPPIVAIEVFDHVLVSGNDAPLGVFLSVSLVGLFLMGVLDVMRGLIWGRAALWLEAWALPRVLMRLRDTESADQVYRDFASIRSVANSNAFHMATDFSLLPIFFCVLHVIHPYFFWLALASVGVMLIVSLLVEYFGVDDNHKLSEIYAESQQHFHRMVGRQVSFTTLRDYFDVNASFLNQKEKLQRAVYDRFNASYAFFRFLRSSIQVCATILGAVLVVHHQITLGSMIGASFLVSRILGPAEAVLTIFRPLWMAFGAWKRLIPSLGTLEGEVVSSREQEVLKDGFLASDHCSFIFSSLLTPAGRVHSLDLASGDRVSFLGKMGSGKSYLAQQLSGLAGSSTVKVNGIVIQNDQSMLRQFLCAFMDRRHLVQSHDVRVCDLFSEEMTYDRACQNMRHLGMPVPGFFTEGFYKTACSFLSDGCLSVMLFVSVCLSSSPLLIFDMPFLGVDDPWKKHMMAVMLRLSREGRILVCFGNDDSFMTHATRLFVLDGRDMTEHGVKISGRISE